MQDEGQVKILGVGLPGVRHRVTGRRGRGSWFLYLPFPAEQDLGSC